MYKEIEDVKTEEALSGLIAVVEFRWIVQRILTVWNKFWIFYSLEYFSVSHSDFSERSSSNIN